jgi:hypothetical protein
MLGEMFKIRAGISLLQVPYNSVPDTIAGRTHLAIQGIPAIAAVVQRGQLRALAVSSHRRLPELPEVPTFSETLPGLEFNGWFAVVAPAGTPREAIQRINLEFNRILLDGEMEQRLRALGLTPRAPARQRRSTRSQERARVLAGRAGKKIEPAALKAPGRAAKHLEGWVAGSRSPADQASRRRRAERTCAISTSSPSGVRVASPATFNNLFPTAPLPGHTAAAVIIGALIAAAPWATFGSPNCCRFPRWRRWRTSVDPRRLHDNGVLSPVGVPVNGGVPLTRRAMIISPATLTVVARPATPRSPDCCRTV